MRITPRHGCLSVIGLITRPEESFCVHEEVLSGQGLSRQIKYVVQSGRLSAEIANSNSTEAWRSVCLLFISLSITSTEAACGS